MRKEIKKYGGSFVITLSPEDIRLQRLEKGSIVEFELKKVVYTQDGNSNTDHIKNTSN